MRRKLQEVLTGVPAHQFITLSCNPGPWRDAEHAFRGMSLAVGELVKRIRRKWSPAGFEYALVWETTRKGWPHVHLIARGPFIPQRWLSRTWQELTHAYIVDIRIVKGGGGVAREMAKYLAKDLHAPPHFKRYRLSHGFLMGRSLSSLLHPPMDGQWRVVKESPGVLLQTWARQGRHIIPGTGEEVRAQARCPPGCFCAYATLGGWPSPARVAVAAT